ncbi:hypothetical protein ACI2KS_01685 [Pseudomonas sp. NPDC087358]|uniref:hypothetical protein n=1 Tax=Pseudomonas sp. NPDC087358 TaxID=3364439 RepID=UPI00384E1F17
MKIAKAGHNPSANAGTPHALLEVEIFDGQTFKEKVPVNDDGSWSATLSSLSLGSHSLTARSASIISTPPRTFAVEAPLPPLVLDESPVSLQETLYILAMTNQPDALPTFPANSTVTRTASGGRPPYTYTSSNSAIVNVTSTGLASPRANGSATVTVRDSAEQAKSYSITVSNVWTAHYMGDYYQSGVEYQQPGGIPATRVHLRAIGVQHRNHWPSYIPDNYYWTNEWSHNTIIGAWYWRGWPTAGAGAEVANYINVISSTFSVYPTRPPAAKQQFSLTQQLIAKAREVWRNLFR